MTTKLEMVIKGLFIAKSENFFVVFQHFMDRIGEGWVLYARARKDGEERVITRFYADEVNPGLSADDRTWKGEDAKNKAEEIAQKLGYL
jgi:hypothetical protein